MKNKTLITSLVVIVFVAIAIAILFMNKNIEIDNTKAPNATTSIPSDIVIETATSTEVVRPTPVASSTTDITANPSFPETGFEPK